MNLATFNRITRVCILRRLQWIGYAYTALFQLIGLHTPDLNPIEHIWKALKAKLRRIHPEYTTLRKNEADRKLLIKWIQEAWDALPERLIEKLTKSTINRLKACRRARGWYTKYESIDSGLSFDI
jgi:hypothetical protein